MAVEHYSNSFQIRADEFFGSDEYLKMELYGAPIPRLLEVTREPMQQLIDRYGLAGKRVLSIGAGHAFEERWLAKAGCQLTLVDLDEPLQVMRPLLAKLPGSSDGEVEYFIEDADRFLSRSEKIPFDACYISSFHPDEIRREEIQKTFCARRSKAEAANYITWPRKKAPYAETMMRSAQSVKPGGLAIFQHYRGGVDVLYNPHYLEQVRDQFASHGLTLCEVYCFRKSPGHLLVVAIKGDEAQAKRFLESLRGSAELSSFHGRYPDAAVRSDVIKVYSALKPELLPSVAHPQSLEALAMSGRSQVTLYAAMLGLSAFLVAAILYGTEAYLASEEWEIELGTTPRIERAAARVNAPWDHRDKVEVIRDLRASGVDAVPAMAPTVLIDADGLNIDNFRFFPFGSISGTTNVFCNEMGDWSIYKADEHGFNNPTGAWRPGNVDLLIVGDSFIHGACLPQGEDIASQVRKYGLNTLNVGIGGTGPIVYNALVKEYAEPVRPKYVLWSHYAVDIRDSVDEVRSPTLKRYLDDRKFSNDLYRQQAKVDHVLRKYYESEYQKRLDELTAARANRRKIITARLIHDGLRLTKLRQRIKHFGGRPVVTEGREQEKLALLERALLSAKAKVESWGGKFVFMYLPDWYAYAAPYDTYGIKVDSNFLLRQDVLALVKRLGIPVIDIQGEVFDKDPDPVGLYNFRMYGHYNRRGYGLVVKKIAEFLKANSKLPLKDPS